MEDLSLNWSLALTAVGQQALRYTLCVVGIYLITTLLFTSFFQKRKIRHRFPPAGQIRRELRASMPTLLILSVTTFAIVGGANIGIFKIYLDLSQYGWLYLIGSTALAIILHDAHFYWSHLLMHDKRLFKYFHREHHKSSNPTPFTSYAFDPSEALVLASFVPLILLVLPLHPLALFIFAWHQMIRNAMGHSGYEFMPARADGKPLFGWMTTVTHHDLHHGDARYNMGLYFTWWDKLMGTEHPDYLKRYQAAITRPTQTTSTTADGA